MSWPYQFRKLRDIFAQLSDDLANRRLIWDVAYIDYQSSYLVLRVLIVCCHVSLPFVRTAM